MDRNLELTLTQSFPQIFVVNSGTNHEDRAQPVAWGFDCGSGWYQLIHDLCQVIMIHCESTGDRVPVAEQVKEKYGELRFYVDSASDGVYRIIDDFEKHSHKVCEKCGDPGRRRLDLGWVITLCDMHYEQKRKTK